MNNSIVEENGECGNENSYNQSRHKEYEDVMEEAFQSRDTDSKEVNRLKSENLELNTQFQNLKLKLLLLQTVKSDNISGNSNNAEREEALQQIPEKCKRLQRE